MHYKHTQILWQAYYHYNLYICMLGENIIEYLHKNEGRESVIVVCMWVRVKFQAESAIEDDWHSGIWWWCAGSRCARPTETRMRTALPAVASVWVRPHNGHVLFSSHSHVSWQITFLFHCRRRAPTRPWSFSCVLTNNIYFYLFPVILMCPDE